MAVEVKMPLLGLMMETGTVTAWNKKEGDTVKKGEEIGAMETDKMANAIESPEDGVLLKIVAPVGTELPPGAPVAYVGAAGEKVEDLPAAGPADAPAQESAVREAPKAAAAAAPRKEGELVRISPLAKKIARENGLDYTGLTGSGPIGRIVRKDVEAALATSQAVPAEAPAAQTASPLDACLAEYESAPYLGIRKSIGDNMFRSWTTAPCVTYNTSVGVSQLLEVRKILNADLGEGEVKLTVTDLLVKLVATALVNIPAVNVAVDGGIIRRYQAVNMGLAVAADSGLVVPVIRGADSKSVSRIAQESKALIEKARGGKLPQEDRMGATFTLSNLGGYKSIDNFSPIVNLPEAAILGVGRTVDTPVVENGEVVVRPMMGLSLTADHRIIDGALAAEFLAEIIRLLKNPIRALV